MSFPWGRFQKSDYEFTNEAVLVHQHLQDLKEQIDHIKTFDNNLKDNDSVTTLEWIMGEMPRVKDWLTHHGSRSKSDGTTYKFVQDALRHVESKAQKMLHVHKMVNGGGYEQLSKVVVNDVFK